MSVSLQVVVMGNVFFQFFDGARLVAFLGRFQFNWYYFKGFLKLQLIDINLVTPYK
jgi:hypothetical protein